MTICSEGRVGEEAVMERDCMEQGLTMGRGEGKKTPGLPRKAKWHKQGESLALKMASEGW